MKTVSARQANHDFSELLSRVERGEEILITKRSKPVAIATHLQKSIRAAEADRPDVAAARAAWARDQTSLDPDRLLMIELARCRSDLLDDRLFCVSTVSRVRTIKALVPVRAEDGLDPPHVHCR